MALFSYNVEPAMEAALVALLGSAGVSAKSTFQRDELAKPYVGVSFELGAELPIDSPIPDGGGISAHYEGQFTLSVVSDRDADTGQHAELRAKVREVLAESTGAQWLAAGLSRYAIHSIRHGGTVYDVLEDDKGTDASAMTYAVRLKFLQQG